MIRILENSRVTASLLAAATLTASATLIGAAPDRATTDATSNVCVREIGDVNGDGRIDHAVSRLRASRPVVFIVHSGGVAAVLDDLESGRRPAALIVRGPEAEPFLCAESPQAPTTRALRALAAPATAPLAASGSLDRPTSYTVIDLDPLMPGFADGFSSAAAAINNQGDVVGRFATVSGDRAYLYRQGVLHDLGTLGGHQSAATGVNDRGDVVGYSLTGETGPDGYVNAAFRFDDHGMRNLGLSWGDARGINSSGRVVGQMRVAPDVDRLTAFALGSDGVRALGSLIADGASGALAINAGGLMVGEATSRMPGVTNPSVSHPSVHPVVFDNGVPRAIAFLGRSCAQGIGGVERCVDRGAATAVTDRGLIVGYSTIGGSTHAFVSDGSTPIDLGTLGGDSTFAYGANESGQVVGSTRPSGGGRPRPFLYDSGVMYDLTTLVDAPAELSSMGAYAINAYGLIALQHHLLVPRYDVVSKAQPFSFDAVLNETVTFEYWPAALGADVCSGGGVSLQMRFNGPRATAWSTVATIGDCQDLAWHPVTVEVPRRLRGMSGSVDVRLRMPGLPGGQDVPLRRFRMR